MEKNTKTTKAKTKIMPIKKPKKVTKKNTIKKTKGAKCCPLFADKKKCAIRILIILIILALIIGLFFLVKSIKKDPTKIDTKRPLDINNTQQTETGEVVETYLLDEEIPTEPEVITQGRFNDVEQNLEGKALFIKSEGETYLRFEKFKTINGQDLHVYLSPILNLDTGDTIDLGLLKSVSGNFNYKLEKDIDIEKYSNVIIWSNPFDAFFGYASLINKELDPEPESEMTEESEQQEQPESTEAELPGEEEATELDQNEEEADTQAEEETTEEKSTEIESTEETTEEETVTEENAGETTEESPETENIENQ